MADSSPTEVLSTNMTLPIPPQVFESYGVRCFRLTFYGIISLASLLGNTVVIKSIFTIPFRKPLTYHMVSSLAVAELVGTLVIPFIQIYDELNTWPFGELMCQLVSPTQVSSGLVVTWTLAVISVHRYCTIVQQSRAVYLKSTSFFIAILWICAVIITFPSFLYSTLVKSPYDDHSYWCVVLFPGESLASFPSLIYKRYLLVRFIINFIVPMVIMLLAYGAIGIKLRCHMIAIRNTENSSSEFSAAQTMHTSIENIATKQNESTAMSNLKSDDSAPGPGSPEAHSSSVILKMNSCDVENTCQTNPANLLIELEQDLLKMIYMIVIIFVLFYIPYQVYFFLEYFEYISYGTWKFHHITRKYIFLMTCLPGALHPLCYGTMSKFYARVFRGIVLCKGTSSHFNTT